MRPFVIAIVSTAVLVTAAVATVGAQGTPASDAEAPYANAATTGAEVSGKPFSARIAVDTPSPVSYGDEVAVSVWITPRTGLDLQYVKIHPKSALARVYYADEAIPVDLQDKSHPGERSPGVNCRIAELSHATGVPFLALCQLTPRASEWSRWLDASTLLGSGQQQFEIEIGVQDGPDQVTSYYEFGAIDFVSAKPAVVIGGFCGALLFALFGFISREVTTPTVAHWKDAWKGVSAAMPQITTSAVYGLWELLRRTLLGGATATILIILAKSSEGFEAPISLRVQDFWGGLLVGMLSTQLSKWLLIKVQSLMSQG